MTGTETHNAKTPSDEAGGERGMEVDPPGTMTAEAGRLAADYGLVVLLAAIFGVSFTLTKVAVADIPPLSLVAARVALVAFGALVVMRLLGQSLPGFGRIWIAIFASGLFGNSLPFFLISWGQERVDAGLAAILMATMPLITIVLAQFFTRDEKLTVFKIIGFVMGVVGVAALIGFDKLASLGDETVRQYAITLAACCYAVNALITKALVGLPRAAMIAALMLASTVLIAPFALVLDDPFSLSPSTGSVVALLLLAVFPTAIGTLLIFIIVKRQGASFLSQINFMVPVFGVLWGILLVNEVLPPNAMVALAIILAGIAVSRFGGSPRRAVIEENPLPLPRRREHEE